ncbi:TIGR03750 family conjugal transfer protein [Nitrogeniibacter aestuarii]|uniref:TIGR03750 family conjugal transfer protein n=1 Tax=Nitrogeniibacter aestuarii TaxID=2815343 RepID=UPI001E4E4838|nr:TIGR03750 family conjugal transfer protein [Nitrogeniibacter aestuarii]
MTRHSDIQDAPLVDRCNGAPPVVRGLTATEVTWVVGVALAFWAPFAVIAWLFTGWPVLAVVVLFIGPALSVYLMAGWFARMKRDRPQDFHVLLAKRWLAKKTGFFDHFISHRGAWDLGRSPLHPAIARRRAKKLNALEKKES